MQLAVVLIHGMGSQDEGFAAPTISALSALLDRQGHDPAEVAWQAIHWADILADRQRGYLDAARQAAEMDFLGLRRFVVSALGDIAAYQYVDTPSPTYARIHDRVRQRIAELYTHQLGATPTPLVVLAHSLGSHIMSSYIWDTQRGHPTGADPESSPFERFEHLAGLVTFGSTIPLFTFAHDPVVAIDFPGRALDRAVAAKARWFNFYDRDDVLGYPLKPTSPSYAQVVTADIEINVGGLVTSATPASHNGYWTDNDFTRPVADFLARLI